MGVWWIGAQLLILRTPIAASFAPGPSLQALARLLSSGELLPHVITSLQRVAVGLGLAVAIGVPLGVLTGLSKRFAEGTTPVFQFLRMVSPLSGRDDIMVISNIREDGKPVGQLPDGEMAFHIDQIYRELPAKGAALHAVEIPDAGGDTMFSNNVAAYEALSPALQKQLEGLLATHSFQYGETQRENRDEAQERPHYTHPLVRRIPENDKRSLAVCRLMTDQIEGLSEDDSRALIAQLCDVLENPANVYSHQWRVGDTLIWDNRCTSHARTDFPSTQRRLMKRVTIKDTIAPLA